MCVCVCVCVCEAVALWNRSLPATRVIEKEEEKEREYILVPCKSGKPRSSLALERPHTNTTVLHMPSRSRSVSDLENWISI